MFPTLRNRLFIAAAMVIGGWVWVSALGALKAADGSAAPTLLTSHAGAVRALLTLLAAGLPAIGLSLVVAAAGNPLSGVFSLATGLWVLAANGDSIEPWIRRSGAAMPGDYYTLAAETLIWALLLALFVAAAVKLRPRLQDLAPVLAKEHHLGEGTTADLPRPPTLVAAGASAVFSGVLAYFLLRHCDKGQIIGALMVAFMLGGMTGDMIAAFLFQNRPNNALRVVIAPALVALTAYLLTATGYRDSLQFLTGLHENNVSGLALALPIHYLSAGVAGYCLGAGAAQVFHAGDKPPQAPRGDDPAADSPSAIPAPDAPGTSGGNGQTSA